MLIASVRHQCCSVSLGNCLAINGCVRSRRATYWEDDGLSLAVGSLDSINRITVRA